MIKNFLWLLTLLACGWLAAEEVNFDASIANMEKRGIRQMVGKSDSLGIYFLCIETVYIEPEMSENAACELGLAKAKKTVAGFLGSNVNASEDVRAQTVMAGKEGELTASTSEVVTEFTRVDVNQFLRGVIVLKTRRNAQEMTVVCFASEKIADAAGQMKQMLEALPPNTVMAVGVAMIEQGNLESAKNHALQSAKRQAVEQVLGTAVASSTQVQDSDKIKSKIFATSSGFIETYRIQEETTISGGYKVVIVATVAKDKLLSDYSAFIKTMGDPGFFVRADNQELYMTFVKFFSGLGLRLVADTKAADYVIDAMGEYRQLKHPASGHGGIQLSLWIRIFDARSNQELLSEKNDPKQSAVFHSTGERQKDIATEKAFAQMKESLHQQLNKLIGKMASSGRPVQIVIDNYSDAFAKELEIITRAVGMVPGCSAPNVKIDGVGMQAVLTADYSGSMDAFENFLRDAMQKEIGAKARIPKTVSVSANRLELSY